MQPKTTSLDIRLRLQVDIDSDEHLLYKYLNDQDSLPYSKREMILRALSAFFLTSAYAYDGRSKEEIRQVLIDADYNWKIHSDYLQTKYDIRFNRDNIAYSPQILPNIPDQSGVPIVNLEEAEEHQAQEQPEEVCIDIFQ